MDREPPAPTVQEIIATVAARAGFSPSDLTGRLRLAEIVRARHQAMWLTRQLCPGLSLSGIGYAFGGRDHSTVLYALRQHEERNSQRDPTAVWLELITDA